MSQEEFAIKLHCKREKISRLESNLSIVEFEILFNIVKIFNIELDWLFFGIGNKYKKTNDSNHYIKNKINDIIKDLNIINDSL